MAEQDEAKQVNGKPDWAIAPEWAEWLAQDADGVWFWWSIQPACEIDSVMDFWHQGGYKNFEYQRARRGDPNPKWRNTRERRPSTKESNQ